MKHKGKPLEVGNNHITIYSTTDGKNTIVELSVKIGDVMFMSTGSSHRVAEDMPDSDVGELLAMSRALENLSQLVKTEARKIH
jgi:hypothetical protein